MVARTSMANLILDLRQKTNAGTADYVVAGGTYWTDDQLQTELDRSQRRWHGVELDPNPQISAGSYIWLDYMIPDGLGRFVEENAGSDSGWAIFDNKWQLVNPSNYTVNYQARTVTFGSNTAGSAYFLDCRTYNMFKTAASIWRNKASAASGNVTWKSDNHAVEASQEYDHCMKMADEFDRKAGVQAGTFWRSDEY